MILYNFSYKILPHRTWKHKYFKQRRALMEYQLELKQIVDFPRCRIYRNFIQTLLNDRSIRTTGGSFLFWYLILCSYANYSNSNRRMEQLTYTLSPGEWICSISELQDWFRCRFQHQAISWSISRRKAALPIPCWRKTVWSNSRLPTGRMIILPWNTIIPAKRILVSSFSLLEKLTSWSRQANALRWTFCSTCGSTLYTMIRLSSALTPALSFIIGIIPVPLWPASRHWENVGDIPNLLSPGY